MVKSAEKSNKTEIIHPETIEDHILIIRGQKVMIDRSLAMLYGVSTGHLNRQVRRNIERFPGEFMFRLSLEEKAELMPKWHQFNSLKHSKTLPMAFTEHGITMLASVLNSDKAVKVSIIIVKTFVKIRQLLSGHKELAQKLYELERKIERHDEDIINIFKAIHKIMAEEQKPKGKFGFV